MWGNEWDYLHHVHTASGDSSIAFHILSPDPMPQDLQAICQPIASTLWKAKDLNILLLTTTKSLKKGFFILFLIKTNHEPWFRVNNLHMIVTRNWRSNAQKETTDLLVCSNCTKSNFSKPLAALQWFIEVSRISPWYNHCLSTRPYLHTTYLSITSRTIYSFGILGSCLENMFLSPISLHRITITTLRCQQNLLKIKNYFRCN